MDGCSWEEKVPAQAQVCVCVCLYVCVINQPEQTEGKNELGNVISATYGATYYQGPLEAGKFEEMSNNTLID